MFAPKLYTVHKFQFLDLVRLGMEVNGDLKFYEIKQQDNMLFRQIRIINKSDSVEGYVFFVDCAGAQSKLEAFTDMMRNGIVINGKHYTMSERSASMTRQGILSFLRDDIYDTLDEIIGLGVKLKETVLSKYMAYRGLMFSSCHCLEGWFPKIIVVPDYYTTIEDQNIKYVVDDVIEYVDKNTGENKQWKQKGIRTGVKNIEINAFDGCGIHHPNITKQVKELLGAKSDPTSLQLRLPYCKGVTHEFDYTTFFKIRDVKFIKDVWGVEHSVEDEMIIFTESMYKGMKYFKKYGDYRDWEFYWEQFHKYNHCIGIAKWNFSKEEEPVYTRGNYQILQDLDLDYDDFATLAQDSIDWVTRIVNGDPLYTYCFLGLTYSEHKPMNDYVASILKNPEMIKEKCVREYIVNLLKKYIDEMKCGKLWLKACFKILAPDLIALAEHIGGLDVVGCLNEHEFYTNDADGDYLGEYLIERNPHICRSEHTVLDAVVNKKIDRWCSHLSNVCMINIRSITPQRLNGADFDGDLVLVVENDTMIEGVDRHCPVVIDIEDKITALSQEVNRENIISIVLKTLNSLIGETSNCATTYHNKVTNNPEQKKKYEEYIDMLSVINGKNIDYAKTGVMYNIPRYIAKYAKPVPYFMKYRSEYYAKMKKFSVAKSNMNRLAKDIESWQKAEIRFKKTYKDFDYKIMMSPFAKYDEETFNKIEEIFIRFDKQMSELSSFASKCKNFEKYKDFFETWYDDIDKDTVKNFEVNWKYYYDLYKEECQQVCPDKRILANIAVVLCYEKYPNKNKKFMWKVASEGILLNIKQQRFSLPERDDNGEYEYLGKKYTMMEVIA